MEKFNQNPIDAIKEYLSDKDQIDCLKHTDLQEIEIENGSHSPLAPEMAKILGEVIRFLIDIDKEL